MKTRHLLIFTIIIIVGMGIGYAIYLEIPRYGATVEGAPKTNPVCEKTIQHGFFLEVPIVEELILDHIKNPSSRLALEISYNEFDHYRNFMIQNFGEPNPNCFLYEYENKLYDVKTVIGRKSYFTHSYFP